MGTLFCHLPHCSIIIFMLSTLASPAMDMAMVKEKESNGAFTSTKPLLSMPLSIQNQESQSEADRFEKSLRELKGLGSQLNHAADYCESAFLKATQKKIILGNTKNYLCEAIVTVIDHLGTVSANLEQRVDLNNKILETEQRIDCLKQRLLTCQNYVLSLDTTLQWSTKFPRHYRHYVAPSAPNAQQSSKSDDSSSVCTTDANVPDNSPCKRKQFTVVVDHPAFDVNSITELRLTNLVSGIEVGVVVPIPKETERKSCNLSFGPSIKDAFKLEAGDKKKKPLQGSNFLSFLKTSKRRR